MTSGGILWLASYPKSGNTWIRVFLENLFRNASAPASINDLQVVAYGDAQPDLYRELTPQPLDSLDEAAIHGLRHGFQRRLAEQPDTAIVKTHNMIGEVFGAPLIHLEFTMGAIYVVRNVFDVAVSFASHYGNSIDEAVEGISAASMMTPRTGPALPQYLGSWSGHYRSWTGIPGFEPLVLRYEDLRARPFKEFSRIVKFLKLPAPADRVKRAIRFSNFEEVTRQEKSHGFKERVRADQVFFRQGRVGGWRQHLSDDHVEALVAAHGGVLRELKYIDKNGSPTV